MQYKQLNELLQKCSSTLVDLGRGQLFRHKMLRGSQSWKLRFIQCGQILATGYIHSADRENRCFIDVLFASFTI